MGIQWPRYKLNYAFNTGQSFKFFGAKSSDAIHKHIDNSIRGCTVEDGFHEVLRLFVTTDDKNLAEGVRNHLRYVANEIYGEDQRDGRREAFLEAIDINIVFRADLSQWDYDQWTDKCNIEATEDELF